MLHIVTQYLRDSAKKYPDYPTLVDQKVSLTYSDTLNEAERIAYELVKRELFKKPVAVLMEQEMFLHS